MIKKFILKLFSMPLIGISGLVFAVSIALATFLEQVYGTNAARAVVYNANWFELLLAYIAVGLVVNVFAKHMIRRGNFGSLLFHWSIFFILLGAGFSRYSGKTGIMHIREGESSSSIVSADVYFDARLLHNGDTIDQVSRKVFPSEISRRFFNETLRYDSGSVKVSVLDFEKGPKREAALVRVSVGNNKEEVWVNSGSGANPQIKMGDFNVALEFGSKPLAVPFSLQLDKFEITRYPGSISPSSFKSYVTVLDNEAYAAEIYMNHVLDHGGYRFFQSSYDDDEKGTVLSVNADKTGTSITYFGYGLLILGMMLALVERKTRFRGLLNSSRRRNSMVATAVLMMAMSTVANAQTVPDISVANSAVFGEVCVQTPDGRIQPLNSFALEIVRKVHKSSSYQDYTAEQVVLGIMRNPAKWQREPLIAMGDDEVKKHMNLYDKDISFAQCFDMTTGEYLLMGMLSRINKIPPEQRSKSDKSFIDLDERINIFNMIKNGRLINLVPDVRDVNAPWLDLNEATALYRESDDSVSLAFNYFVEGLIIGNNDQFYQSLSIIKTWQASFSHEIMPSDLKIKSELWYNKANIFERLTLLYGMASLLFLAVTIWLIVSPHKLASIVQTIMFYVLIFGFVLHTVGLILRGYIAGHTPISNGYEAMVFVSWTSLLAGIIFLKQSRLVLALFGVLAAAALLVAHLSFMNPQITTLVPVLKSYWLTVHVAVITSSYGFLGGSFVLGLITLLLWVGLSHKNKYKLGPVISKLITINRIIMIPGLYLLTIGCFLGGIWANQSWGNYWSWDPKETWCLVSILLYSFVVHLHHYPGMRGKFVFVMGSVFAYGAIIMTFFGVNYFLGGMHSYAGEGNFSIPMWLYVSVPILIFLVWRANKNNQKHLSSMYC